MKKVQFSVRERLELPNVLPEKGGYIQQEIVSLIKEKIRFTAEEMTEYEMKDLEDGRVLWNPEKAKDRMFSFEDPFIAVMKEGVDALDKAKAIPQVLFPICKKIRSI